MLLISVPTKSFMKHMYSSFTPKLGEKQEAGKEREREGRGEGGKKERRREEERRGRGGKEEGRRGRKKGRREGREG